MWAVYNKIGCRMYQYPTCEYEDQMMRVLRKAQENNPEAGFRLRWVEPEPKEESEVQP